jgi:hypothetical protein
VVIVARPNGTTPPRDKTKIAVLDVVHDYVLEYLRIDFTNRLSGASGRM